MGKHGKEMSLEEKNVIVSMIDNGYRSSEIGQVLGRTKSTVSKFLKRFRERGHCENESRRPERPVADSLE